MLATETESPHGSSLCPLPAPAGGGRARGRAARTTAALVLLAFLLPAPAGARAPRGDPAARLPSGSLAGEYWDLVARFDSGHLLVATFTLTNVLGSRMAVAVGKLIEPDGAVHAFSRTESNGESRLEGNGRRIDLYSIVLDQTAPPHRFVVDKNELGIEVAFDAAAAPAWPAEDASAECPLDVLEMSAVARGDFRLPGREPVALSGLATITHRWMPGLEVECLRRGVELFAMEGDLGVYFREALTPGGSAHAWLLVQRGGRTLFAGPPSSYDLRWREGRRGYPELAGLRLDAPGVTARVEPDGALDSFEPLRKLPGPLRWLMEFRTRPRLSWSTPRCEIELETEQGPVALGAPALLKLAYTNPMASPADAAELPRNP